MSKLSTFALMAAVSASDYYQPVDVQIPEANAYKRWLSHDSRLDYYQFDTYYISG